jgi:hypothetical protein
MVSVSIFEFGIIIPDTISLNNNNYYYTERQSSMSITPLI